MAGLKGFSRVAVVTMANRKYRFALYDDDIKVGDHILVSGSAAKILVVEEILSAEESPESFKNNIISEVICKIDTSAYEKRVADREREKQLKKELDKKIKELQSVELYKMYAEKFPEISDLVAEYNSLQNQ